MIAWRPDTTSGAPEPDHAHVRVWRDGASTLYVEGGSSKARNTERHARMFYAAYRFCNMLGWLTHGKEP